jgi:hypothetical protein
VTVYTVLMANTAGLFANTGATAFQVSVDLGPCGSYTQTPSVSTSVTIGVPGESDIAQAIEGLEGPMQMAVQQSLSSSSLTTQQAIQDGVDDAASALGLSAPTLYVTSFPAPTGCEETSGWTNSYIVQTFLLAANSGLGASYGLSFSYVQLSMSGQEVLPYTPPTATSLKLTLSSSSTSFNQAFSGTVQVEQCEFALFGYCFLYEPLSSTPSYPYDIVSVSYPTIYGGMLGSADCVISNSACTLDFTPDTVQAGYDTLTAFWGGVPAGGGSPGLAQSADTAKISITPGLSTTSMRFPGGDNATVGQVVFLQASVAAQNGVPASISGGTVTFLEEPEGGSNSTYVGSCALVGNGCQVNWTPGKVGRFTMSAAWTGNVDLTGSVSPAQTFVVTQRPVVLDVGVGPVAKGSFSCATARCGSAATAGFDAIEVSGNTFAPDEDLIVSTKVAAWDCPDTATCTATGFYGVVTNSTGGFQAASYCSFTGSSGCSKGEGAATVTDGIYEVSVCDTSGDCSYRLIRIIPPTDPAGLQPMALAVLAVGGLWPKAYIDGDDRCGPWKSRAGYTG